MEQRRERLSPGRSTTGRRQNVYALGSISQQVVGNLRKTIGSRMQQATPDEVSQFAVFFSSLHRNDLWPKNKDRALRNELLIKLLLQTGGRVSELLAIKDTDLVTGKQMVQFARRHNDPDDPRKNNPTLKTYDRQLRLSRETWELLMEWLDVQDELTAHNPQAFLFVNLTRDPRYAGQPMSRMAVDQMIREVCVAAGIKPFGAHQLRHLYVRELAKLAREQGWTNEEWRKAATYLLGWSLTSKMPALYLGEAANQEADLQMKQLWTERGLEVE
ncbi:tyrosine-type recombinase/integrase [Sulfitobacter profundi]|uniref:Tyrosine-type recombinase/integrase n=2 Tax=Sulfitobacter TaxID=60136 RepID=A0ABW1Z290_9RHOB